MCGRGSVVRTRPPRAPHSSSGVDPARGGGGTVTLPPPHRRATCLRSAAPFWAPAPLRTHFRNVNWGGRKRLSLSGPLQRCLKPLMPPTEGVTSAGARQLPHTHTRARACKYTLLFVSHNNNSKCVACPAHLLVVSALGTLTQRYIVRGLKNKIKIPIFIVRKAGYRD